MQRTRQSSTTRVCLLCGGTEYSPILTECQIDILKCSRCRHVFSSYKTNPHYEGFWGRHVPEGKHAYWSEARREMYQDFMRRFIAGRSGRLLDFGSGLGFFLKAMAKHENWEAFGCAISPGAVQFARETLAIKNVRCGRLENMDFQAGSFDLITMWDVLEHLPEPRLILRRCHDLLKEGGRLFIRTPNVTVASARWRRATLRSMPSRSTRSWARRARGSRP